MRLIPRLILPLLLLPALVIAQETPPAPPPEPAPAPALPAVDELPATPVPSEEERFRRFSGAMNRVRLVGQFTTLGREDTPPKREEYIIESVTKLPQGDFWMFRARIRYGDKDISLPLPLEVKWAGDTPVITLTKFTIPGLGTFGSRVVIYEGMYAGTWSHGEAAGHLFGTVQRIEPAVP